MVMGRFKSPGNYLSLFSICFNVFMDSSAIAREPGKVEDLHGDPFIKTQVLQLLESREEGFACVSGPHISPSISCT